MNKDLIILCKELEHLSNLCLNKKLRHFYNNVVYNSRFLYFNNILSSEIINKSPYRNIVLNFLKKSEKYLPGGSLIASILLINHIKKIENNSVISKEKNLSTFKELLSDTITSDKFRNIILNTLEFAGADGSINCKKSKNKEICITKNTNAKIKINIADQFESIYFKNVDETTKSCTVLCMDAYLERESEIMTILEEAKKNNTPLLIFCRGMSDYFVRNIKEIIIKNNIYVYPYLVKFDNNDPFLLDDICAAFEVDKVSAEGGDSFYKDLVKKSRIVQVRLKKDGIEFFNKPKKTIEEINKSLSSCHDKELKDYLLKRKNRLSPNVVNVLVPDSETQLLNDFRSVIKIYNIAAISGIVEFNKILMPKYSFNQINSLTNSIMKSISNISYVVKLPSGDSV